MSEFDFGLFKLVFDDEKGEAYAFKVNQYEDGDFDIDPEPEYELVHDYVYEEDEEDE